MRCYCGVLEERDVSQAEQLGTDTDTDGYRDRWIGGIAYWFPHPAGAATTALLLDYEQVNFRDFATAQRPPTQKRIMVHGLINF